MAENGAINGHSKKSDTEWRVGFMSHSMKYLTAEQFGFKVNASGAALKKKQIWTIEQNQNETHIYIRSHLGRYMSSDKYGNVTVEAEEKGDEEKFVVEYSQAGKWAFKNVAHNFFLCDESSQVNCTDKIKKDNHWWSIQLYIHPQINLRNVNRKRYAHLNKENNELECTEVTPWGADSQLFLDFLEGKYTLRACDNRYLNRDGTLQENIDCNTTFTMEIHSGSLAFKDVEGRYLTAVGQGTMKARNKNVSKDERFTIEESHPQVQIVARNGKFVSVKQGVDVSANQSPSVDDIGDTEIFQLEFDRGTGLWALRTCANKYWSLQSGTGTIHAVSSTTNDSSFFAIDWQDDGSVGIKSCDGKYLSCKQTGILFSSSNTVDESTSFRINIVNKPFIVLKSEFGFVARKGSQYICNKSTYDCMEVIGVGDGTYHLKGTDGKYIGIADDNTLVSDDGPSPFRFQFCGCSQVAIKAHNRCFLTGEQNGLFKANADEIIPTALWEF